jgi:SulP family sulfate permease
VAGGLSQSSVNDKAGAKTPLALVFASLTIGLCLMYLTGLLYNLPNVVLAAIVLVAVKGLINIGELRHVWRVSRFEFGVSMVAFAGVLLLGILKGVIVAVLVSMLLLIRRAAHPHVAFLGRIPGTRSYSDIERNPDNEAVPGVLMFRVEASLLYFNVEHVRDAVWQKVRSTAGPLSLVVCDLSTSPIVDLAGARMLAKLHESSRQLGSACAWWRRMRRCATSCAPRAWRKASATSAAGSRWLTSSTSFRAAREMRRPDLAGIVEGRAASEVFSSPPPIQ